MVVTLCTLTPVHVTFVCVSLVTTTNSVIHCFGRKVLSIVKCQALSLFTMLFNFGTALPPTQKQVSYLETFAKYRSQNFPKWKSNTWHDLSFIRDFIQLVNFAHMLNPDNAEGKANFTKSAIVSNPWSWFEEWSSLSSNLQQIYQRSQTERPLASRVSIRLENRNKFRVLRNDFVKCSFVE